MWLEEDPWCLFSFSWEWVHWRGLHKLENRTTSNKTKLVVGRLPVTHLRFSPSPPMTLTKRVRILASEDVEEHVSLKSCWVTRDGKVYDVTQFLPDHPGGDDLILKYAGKDVGEIMKDSSEHDHSDSAYSMLDEFLIGQLGADAGIVDENWVATEDFQPDETDASKDYEKNLFLDLRRPLLSQFFYANFSKSYYLQQIHQPRHVVQSARLFGPSYLEVR